MIKPQDSFWNHFSGLGQSLAASGSLPAWSSMQSEPSSVPQDASLTTDSLEMRIWSHHPWHPVNLSSQCCCLVCTVICLLAWIQMYSSRKTSELFLRSTTSSRVLYRLWSFVLGTEMYLCVIKKDTMYIVSFVDKINAEHLYKKNFKCQVS